MPVEPERAIGAAIAPSRVEIGRVTAIHAPGFETGLGQHRIKQLQSPAFNRSDTWAADKISGEGNRVDGHDKTPVAVELAPIKRRCKPPRCGLPVTNDLTVAVAR